jgi:hypothetical protein
MLNGISAGRSIAPTFRHFGIIWSNQSFSMGYGVLGGAGKVLHTIIGMREAAVRLVYRGR